jgi:hypothetical protein
MTKATKMSSGYFNVSGIDQNEGAEHVFVRFRNGNSDDDILLGSGRVVGLGGCSLPPGIQVGQFSVTFLLPDGCSADNIVVSRDKSGKELLSGVTLTRCLIRAEARSGGTIIPDHSPVSTGATNVASHLINRGQITMAQKTGSEA